MTTPQSSSARFRSATEFPKSINQLNQTEADQLYAEMRECLIFTNRSRSQLIRRNEEHKQSVLQVRSEVDRLQQLIQKLNLEKQQLAVSNENTVSELTQQIELMSGRLDELVSAFDGIADIENPVGFMAQPGRFFRFIQAIKAIVLFWRDQDDQDGVGALLPSPKPSNPSDAATDRRENPQMYQDQASIGRSLLDD